MDTHVAIVGMCRPTLVHSIHVPAFSKPKSLAYAGGGPGGLFAALALLQADSNLRVKVLQNCVPA